MKFWEAMKALEEGKKVRRKDWDSHLWIAKKSRQCLGRECVIYYMSPENYEYEWEIFPEPEKIYNFQEIILKAKKDGIHFKRRNHCELYHWHHWCSEWQTIRHVSELGDASAFLLEDIEATDWIIRPTIEKFKKNDNS